MNPHRTPLVVVAALVTAAATATAAPAAAGKEKLKTKIHDRILTVSGTNQDDAITLRLAAGDPSTLEVLGDAKKTDELDRSKFDRIVVQAGGGDDTITIDQSNGLFTTTQPTTLDGEAGNDTIVGGDGAETLVGGDGNDIVDGGRGNDTALLGGGDDSFSWDPGDGSDTVEGGAGADTLQFNGSNANEQMELSANGQRLRFARDIAAVTMDTNGVEHIGIATHAGTDTVTVNDLAGTGVTNVDVTGDSPNVVAAGTAADDAFTVGGNSVTAFGTAITSTGTITVDGRDGNDTTTVEGTESADSITLAAATPAVAIGPTVRTLTENIRVNGNGGDDVITAGNGLATLASLTLDGGAGNDRIVGGDGADVLVGGDGTDTVAGGRGNDTALLGAGDDSFTWDPGDGSDAVEGGAGADTLQFNGSNANEQMELSADGRRLRFARDIAAVTMDTNGVEHIGIETRAGTDSVTVNDLAGTGVADVDVTGDSPNVIAGGTPADDSFVFSGGALQAFGTALTSTGTLTADGRGGNDTTTVQGTDNADTISIAGASPAVAVSPNLRTLTESLVVDGNGGDDTIAAQNGLATLTSLTINGGDGNDTLTGGDGDDLIDAGNGNDIVDGGRGNDTALLGAGDDSFTWDPGDASDTVEGGDGDDTLVFNGSNANEQIDLGANGSRLRLTRDIAAVTMDTAGVEQVDIATKGGTDTVTVHDLTGTGATATAVHVDLGSDGQADQVVVFGTDAEDVIGAAGSAGAVTVTGARAPVQLAGADPIDAVVIDALGDDDVVNGSGLAADTAHLVADGGEGDDVLVGGDGDDTLLGGPGDDVLNGGPGQDVLDGGTGSNVLIQG